MIHFCFNHTLLNIWLNIWCRQVSRLMLMVKSEVWCPDWSMLVMQLSKILTNHTEARKPVLRTRKKMMQMWIIGCVTRGMQKKTQIHDVVFLHLRPQKAPSPLLPISEIITKLSKTLIILLCYILPQPPWNQCQTACFHLQSHTHWFKDHTLTSHQSYGTRM